MTLFKSGYWPRRLVRNAGVLAVATAVHLAVVTANSDAHQVMFRLSIATGYASVVLIAWAMLIGPWRVLAGRSAPVSTDLRRDVGFWGGMLGIVHVVTGLQVHFSGRMLMYFFDLDKEGAVPVRYDQFGFANWTGLAATVLLVMLLVISNDISLRGLGTRRWKAWQRTTYWMAVLVVAHTLAYQLLTQHHEAYVAAFLVITAIVLALQLRGRHRVVATRAAVP